MIQVAEALGLVEFHSAIFSTERVPLLQSAGRVLAEAIYADRDFPPFDRVMMDGVAIQSAAFENGERAFKIEGLQPAGAPQQVLFDPGSCIEVMTGAVLPQNTDTIVPYEECSIANGVVKISSDSLRPLQHVHQAGSDTRSGAILLERNQRITPAAIGILASVGKSEVTVLKLPKVAICSTGDELVEPDASPLPHQIRRSNSYMLAAALQEEGITGDMHHLPDVKTQMFDALREMSQRYDVLLFSGAVSKGKYDFLPEVLSGLGMETIFHRIAQKPGKPMLFGRFESGSLVFGFPGNPASTLVCYELYFQAWLRKSMQQEPDIFHARLSETVVFSPALTNHLLVTIEEKDGVLLAVPCPAANSGDMIGLQRADAILSLPAERNGFEAGEVFEIRMLKSCF